MADPAIPLSVDATSLAAAQANQLTSTGIMVDNINANLKTIFLVGFSNWAQSVEAGKAPNTNPPHPPKAYVISPPDANGFQWPVVGTLEVTPMPPIPQDHFNPPPKLPPTVPGIGHWITGRWYSCLHSNTWTSDMGNNGETMPIQIESSLGGPAADGKVHTFQFYSAPVGEGWWLLVS